MADYDLIAIIDHRLLGNRAHCEDETLWWINDCGETVDPHSAEIGNSERSALKFFRLHPLVAGSAGQIFRHLAEFTQRFVLRRADYRSEQTVWNGNGDAEIHVGILNNRIASKR